MIHPGADLYHAPHRPGNVAATLGPSVRCPRDWCSPPGGASPHLPVHTSHAPYNTSWSSLPRAVCERYKPDRRCSSPGLGVSGPLSLAWKSGPSPALNPQAGASCIPLCGVSAAGGGGWRSVGPLLPPGSVGKSALCVAACPGAAACWGQKEQNQEEEEHLACHAALPGSPTCGRDGFTRVEFKESLQRQLFGLPKYRNHLPPSPASSSPIAQAGIFLGLSLLPAVAMRCAPGSLHIPPGTPGKASFSRGAWPWPRAGWSHCVSWREVPWGP